MTEKPSLETTPLLARSGTVSVSPRHRRSSFWFWGLLSVLVPAAAWGGNQGWHWFRTRQFRTQCEQARLAEDWRSERDLARAWTDWDPSAGAGWWFAAEAAQKLDDQEDLVRCLGKIPAGDPNLLFALVEKANLEWSLNHPLEAMQTSARALAIKPDVLEVQSRVISFYAMNLQRAPMLKAIRAALAAGAEPPESYPYLIMADSLTFTNGAKLNRHWLSSAPNDLRFKIGLAVHTAMSFAQNADAGSSPESQELNREAARQLGMFLDEVPNDAVLLTYLMERAYQAGDVDRVGQLLAQVDDAALDDHMIWVYRCWYHMAFDDYDKAEQAVREALRLHPLSPLAHHEYANVLRKAQRAAADVEREQRLAAAGRELRTQMLHLPSALDASSELLRQVALYAESCGDDDVFAAIEMRLDGPIVAGPTTPGER